MERSNRNFIIAALSLVLTASASPPPDADSSCGGPCQRLCINGCDSNYNFSWRQGRCIGPHPWSWGDQAPSVLSDSKGVYCSDDLTCDYGPCGRDGERPCNTELTVCLACGNFGYGAELGADQVCHKTR
jgi:hypothetical protein